MNGLSPDRHDDSTRAAAADSCARDRKISVETAAPPRSLAILHRVAGLGSAVLALTAIGLFFYFSQFSPGEVSYRTGVGDYLRAVLDDGSVVELNTDTQITVRFSDEVRVIEMSRGEAAFTVAKDKRRPFVVHAGQTRVRAVGTEFAVRVYSPRHVGVLVTEGEVAVRHQPPIHDQSRSDHDVGPAYAVAAGQTAEDNAGQIVLGRSGLLEKSRRLSWREGRLQFDGASLTEVVEAFNRYNQLKLVIADSSIADTRFGGQFPTTGVEAFLTAWTNQVRGGRIARAAGAEPGSEVVMLYGPPTAQ